MMDNPMRVNLYIWVDKNGRIVKVDDPFFEYLLGKIFVDIKESLVDDWNYCSPVVTDDGVYVDDQPVLAEMWKFTKYL
jgi:hypothetical protein